MPRKFNVTTISVSKNQGVEIDPLTNALTFINTGNTLVNVNGIPLNAGVPGTNNGESFSIPGNYDEVFSGRIDVAFPGGGAGAQLLVIQKFYLPE
jgi:hypothetical protein